jgi:hypothetical protein
MPWSQVGCGVMRVALGDLWVAGVVLAFLAGPLRAQAQCLQPGS